MRTCINVIRMLYRYRIQIQIHTRMTFTVTSMKHHPDESVLPRPFAMRAAAFLIQRQSGGYGQSPYYDSGFQRSWLKHNLSFKGWKSQVPGKSESRNLSRDDLGRETGRTPGWRRAAQALRKCQNNTQAALDLLINGGQASWSELITQVKGIVTTGRRLFCEELLRFDPMPSSYALACALLS